MERELTRRDALAALAATGATVGTLGALTLDGKTTERETLVAVARTVYPDDVENVSEFVETFLAGRFEDRPDHARAVLDAAATIDEYAREYEDSAFVDLSPERRDDLLRSVGLDLADPDPEGARPSRLRYYLVNELLFALYTSPTGGRLVGIENPQGYPGGTSSYQQPPE